MDKFLYVAFYKETANLWRFLSMTTYVSRNDILCVVNDNLCVARRLNL